MIRKNERIIADIMNFLDCSMHCLKRFEEANSQMVMLDALDEIDGNCRAILLGLKWLGYSYEEAKEKIEYVGSGKREVNTKDQNQAE